MSAQKSGSLGHIQHAIDDCTNSPALGDEPSLAAALCIPRAPRSSTVLNLPKRNGRAGPGVPDFGSRPQADTDLMAHMDAPSMRFATASETGPTLRWTRWRRAPAPQSTNGWQRKDGPVKSEPMDGEIARKTHMGRLMANLLTPTLKQARRIGSAVVLAGRARLAPAWAKWKGRGQPDLASKSLLAAARLGDKQGLAMALAQGACIEAKGANKGLDMHTAAMISAVNGDVDCLRFLIAEGADIEAHDGWGSTAAMLAASRGRAACLALLIASGADLDAKDCVGWTAAMNAARQGQSACLGLLIAAKVDLEAKGFNGITAAIWAARGPSEACLNLLIAAGADLDATSDDGMTPSMHASSHGHTERASFIDGTLLSRRGAAELDLALEPPLLPKRRSMRI